MKDVARKQVIVQLDDDLVRELDRLARRLKVSRSELVRFAARGLIETHRRGESERRHAEAYRRIPQDPELVEALGRAAAATWPEW